MPGSGGAARPRRERLTGGHWVALFVLYLRHPSSLEHDPTVLSPEHPDTPERIGAIDAAMAAAGWLGCDVREAPAATELELELVHTRSQVRMVHDLCATGGGQIAAELAVRELAVERVLILDWDVHHGNGTAHIFRTGATRSVSASSRRARSLRWPATYVTWPRPWMHRSEPCWKGATILPRWPSQWSRP